MQILRHCARMDTKGYFSRRRHAGKSSAPPLEKLGAQKSPEHIAHRQLLSFMGRMKDLPRVRFHDLRHSHATQLLISGVHPKIASERLGHASAGITLDLYSHVTDSMQSEAAVKLDSAMQDAKSRLAGGK